MDVFHIGQETIKAITGFVFLFIAIKITGRNSINQLTPFHLVYVMVLGNFLGTTIYDDDIRVFELLYSIGIWTLLKLLLEFIDLKRKSTRFFLDGKPALIIRDGMINRKLLKKNKMNINQVLSLLRQNNIFSVREVKYGLLEPNGEISTMFYSKHQQVSRQDFRLPDTSVDLPVSLIIDGEILWDNLQEYNLDKQWLHQQLVTQGYQDEKDIFYADWKKDDGIHINPK